MKGQFVNLPVNQYWKLLRDYLKPLIPKVILLMVLLVSSIGLKVLNPQLIRHFIDAATNGDTLQELTFAAFLFLAFALLIQALGVVTVYVGEDIGWLTTNALRADLAQHCLRLDMSFHNERTPGEMIERIDGDVIDLAVFFSQFVVQIMGNLLLVV